MKMMTQTKKNHPKWVNELYAWKYVDWPAFYRIISPDLKKDTRLIDIGCGDGRVIREFLEMGLKQKNILGIDIDDEMITVAREEFPEAEFEVEDVRKWKPVQNGQFDIAIAFHVLHFFNKNELTLLFRAINNSLREQGRFAFLVAHPIRWVKNDLSRYFDGGVKEIRTSWDNNLRISLNTLEDYAEALASSGFVIERLLEPKPIKEGRSDIANYKRYLKGPSRLLISAIKRG